MKTKINLQLAMLFIAVIIGANTFAQGLYMNAGAGYGFPAASYLMADNIIYNSTGEFSVVDYEIVKGSGSFGKGLQAGAIFGYMFNPNIGAELGISYLFGGKIESKDEDHYQGESSMYENTRSAKMLRFTPALKMTVGNGDIKPYMRSGLVIGTAGKIKSVGKDTFTGEFNNGVTEREMELTGGISLGFAGALGADFMLSDKIGLFTELGVITQSWAPKKGEVTRYTVDGVDRMNDLKTREKEFEFVESYTVNYPTVDENSPTQTLKMYQPFSSFSLNAGVRIALGGSSK